MKYVVTPPIRAKMSSVIGKTVVLLLCGADKRTQSTDTKRAIEYLKDYKKRNTKS